MNRSPPLWFWFWVWVALGCTRAPTPVPLPVLREHARQVLARRCARCHDPTLPTALPGALAVFNVTDRDWSHAMDARQLHSAVWRLGEPLPPEGATNPTTDTERAVVARYVAAEIRHRQDGHSPR